MSGSLTKTSGQFTETAIDDEIVVMHLASGEFFSLTETGRTLWLLIDGTRNRDKLLAEVAAHYGAQPAEIVDDVDAFLAKLRLAGFLDPA